MNNILNYQRFLWVITTCLLLIIILFGTLPLFILTAIFIFVFLVIKLFTMVPYSLGLKIILFISYTITLILQLVFYISVVFSNQGTHQPLLHFIAAATLPLPFLLEDVVIYTKNTSFYLPSVEEVSTITFSQMKRHQKRIYQAVNTFGKFRHTLSMHNLQEIFSDLNRHSAIRYVNNGSLDNDYFQKAEQSLTDPGLYIVISNTGSAASELIGLFTQKQFNHASLSFDADLTTIISYNGGERVYPPGLNPEMIHAFHKKADASVLIYRLPVSVAQKRKVIDTIKQINQTGSAYNILGLVTKHSMRRNIMFCSQFVYTMLQIADATYFDKEPGHVQPTDFIELDYHRKLTYVSEIKF